MYQAERVSSERGQDGYQAFPCNPRHSVCLVFFSFVGLIAYRNGYQRQADILELVNLDLFFIAGSSS
jgi:hypothetical protein